MSAAVSSNNLHRNTVHVPGEEAGEAAAAAAAAAAADDDSSGPPYIIMEHLPLAVLVNGVLAALNELRHCAMLSISKPLAGWVVRGKLRVGTQTARP